MRRLVVAVPDRVSAWIEKGEVVERYLNPGDLFDEVHLLLTNDDRPDLDAIRVMAGSAEVAVHNVPTGLGHFVRTAGWRPTLLRPWLRRAVGVVAEIQPSLVRCHGIRLNALAAAEARRRLGIPFVVSVHTDHDFRHHPAPTVHDRAVGMATASIQRVALRQADAVLPVYRSIVPWLTAMGARRIEVVHNPVSPEAVGRTSWDLGSPVRVITVSRQIPGKNPRVILEAVALVPGVELLVVGDGPLHRQLVDLARELGIEDRVTFRRAMPNRAVVEAMAECDLYLHSSAFPELTKTVMEAGLTGLPIIADTPPHAAPELFIDAIQRVPSDRESMAAALQDLIADDDRRRRLGVATLAHARRHWAPEKLEARIVEIYEDVMDRS